MLFLPSSNATKTIILATVVLVISGTRGSAQRVLGIDVSTYQGDLSTTSWATFKRATNQQVSGVFGDGRDFVFVRVSRGGTTGEDHRSGGYPVGDRTLTNLSQRYDDPYFVQNITRATAAGMLAGPYHFSRPDIIASTGNSGGIPNNGTDEANHFIEMAGAWMRPGYLLPVHDFEAGDGLRTDNEMAQFCIDFSDRIHAVIGIRPAIYINGNYAEFVLGRASSSLQAAVMSAYPTLWTARWPNQDDPNSIPVQTSHPKDTISYIYGPWDDSGVTHPWVFWQYASTARLNGYANGTANIDVDVAQGGIDFIKDYLVPALWVNDQDGQWATLTNWNSGLQPIAPVQGPGQLARVGTLTLPTPRLPGSADTVVLDRPNTDITITLGSGAHTIRKLYAREALNITNGLLTINYIPSPDSSPISAQFSAPVTLSGGILSIHTLQVDATRTFTMGGGALIFNTINLMPHNASPATIALNGDVTLNPTSGATATIGRGSGAGIPGFINLGGSYRIFNIGNGSGDVDFSADVSIVNGGLGKAGAGTMRLTGVNNYSDGTSVTGGKLLVNNAAGSGTGSGSVSVESGGILGGTGTIAGRVTILTSGTLAPGTSIGTLTISNSLTLFGTTIMELNAATRTNDLVRGLTSVTYGGTLVLSNLAGSIGTTNAFKLFNASSYSGAFGVITPATPGLGLGWNTNTLASDGTLRILNTAPATLTSTVSGGLLRFSWPADHIGWRLQVQTNSISVGLSTNWLNVPDSLSTNQITFAIDPAIGCAFYRLVYP